MDKYLRLLEGMGMDPDEALSFLEKRIRDTKGQVYSYKSAHSGLRVLENEKDDKLLNVGLGYDFEHGLKNLSDDVIRHGLNTNKHTKGATKPSSNIDKWVMDGGSVSIRAEKGPNGAFIIGAGASGEDRKRKPLFELRANKLTNAFEAFNSIIPELSDEQKNSTNDTITYELKDDDKTIIKGK